MKKIIYAVSIVAVMLVSLTSCKQKSEPVAIDAAHNSRNSVDWQGSYKGIVPCADCAGISVQLTLNDDETYLLNYQYLDKDETVYSESGKFTWDKDGGIVTLDCKDWPSLYKVGENKLFQLDMEGNEITGELAENYILTKVEECHLAE